MSDFGELADLIRSHKPPQARAYFLKNYNGRFPAHGGYGLEPFEAPKTAGGQYSLGFLSAKDSNTPLTPLQAHQPAPYITVPESQSLAVKADTTPEKVAKSDRRDPIEDHPDHIANRVEFEQIRMADQTIKAKHLLGKGLGQIEEMAGTLLYAKAWRQEAERNIQSRDRDRTKLIDEVLRISSLLVQERNERPLPPPAPPDHVTPGLALLGQIVGMAGAALSPAIAKQQSEKGDPIMDAIIGVAAGEDKAGAVDRLTSLKRELEKAKADLEAKKAGRAEPKPAPTMPAAPASAPAGPDTSATAPASPPATAPSAPSPAEVQLQHLTSLLERVLTALAPKEAPQEAEPPEKPATVPRRQPPSKPKSKQKALPPKRGAKS